MSPWKYKKELGLHPFGTRGNKISNQKCKISNLKIEILHKALLLDFRFIIFNFRFNQ